MSSKDDYKINKRIGKGSYGSVYVVTCRSNEKKYVMKKIPLSDMNRKEKRASKQEVSLIERLKHPTIVAYKDSYLDNNDEDLCIVMTYCDGGDLGKKIKQHTRSRRMKEKMIMDIFAQIMLGMDFMHTRKVLHRDIKSQNIFLTKKGEVKIGDFGIARVFSKTLDLAKTSIGTPLYMSPEVCNNRPYGFQSDMWSCGCILYEMCCLKHPFDARDLRSLFMKIMRGVYSPVPYKYNSKLRNIIKRLLNTNPKKRPTVRHLLLKNRYLRKYVKMYCARKLKEAKIDENSNNLNRTFDDRHIEINNLRIQMAELNISESDLVSGSSSKSGSGSEKKDVPSTSSNSKEEIKKAAVKSKEEKELEKMKKDLEKLKLMEKEKIRVKKVLAKLRRGDNDGKKISNPVNLNSRAAKRREILRKDEERKKRKIQERQMNRLGNAEKRRNMYRKKKKNLVSGGAGALRKKKKPVRRIKNRVKSTEEIRRERDKAQRDIDKLEKQIKLLEEGGILTNGGGGSKNSNHYRKKNYRKNNNSGGSSSSGSKKEEEEKKYRRMQREREKEILLEKERKRILMEQEKEKKRLKVLEEKKKKEEEENLLKRSMTRKEYILYMKKKRQEEEEKKKIELLRMGRKEYHNRKQKAKLDQYGLYHNLNPDVVKKLTNSVESEKNDWIGDLENQLPPSKYGDFGSKEKKIIVEGITEKAGDILNKGIFDNNKIVPGVERLSDEVGNEIEEERKKILEEEDEERVKKEDLEEDKKLIGEYEKNYEELGKDIQILRKTITQKYGNNFQDIIKKIAEEEKEKKRKKKKKSETLSDDPYKNDLLQELKNIDDDSDDDSDDDDSDDDDFENAEDHVVGSIEQNQKKNNVGNTGGGPLAERIRYLRKTCIEYFGNDIFQNLYKFYKTEYYVIKSDEKRAERMAEIVGNEGKIHFCHLCDELVFVENTLYNT